MSRLLPVIGCIAVVLAVALGRMTGATIGGAFLFAWLLWIGLPLGALALLMASELIGGGLEESLGPALRTILQLLFPLAPFVLVLGLVLAPLYPWKSDPAAHPVYFTTTFFILRGIGYLLVWTALAWVFSRPPHAHDTARKGVAVVGVVLHPLIGTLAATDWAMALEPHWQSSIYGVLMIWGQMVGAFALALVLTVTLTNRLIRSRDLGAMLLGGVALWIYLHAMQFLVIYAGDLPSETGWLIRRESGLWLTVALTGLTCHFLVPFLTMLNGHARAAAIVVAAMAGLVLVGHALDTAWLILPAIATRPLDAATIVLMTIGIGTVAGGVALRQRPVPLLIRQ